MNELVQQLVSQLGVQPDQARGGAGLIFKLVQDKLGGDFSKVSQAMPGVTDLIKAAPQPGGGASLLGGLAAAVGGKGNDLAGLASLAGGFSKLKLDPALVGKFVPVVLAFIQSSQGKEVMALVAGVLKK